MPIDHFVGVALVQIMRQHRNQTDAALNALGLHVGQEMLLFHLWEKDGITQTEIAGCVDVSAPTVTKMLNGLEAAGLIERRPDAEDGRISRVYLTAKGRALEGPVIAVWDEIEARLLDGLSEVERALLRRLLMHMRDNLARSAT